MSGQQQGALESELDSVFSQYAQSEKARGVVYGLVGPEGLMHSSGFGVSRDAGSRPDADTVFPIASLSKSFVACAALLAQDRGLLDLDLSLGSFLDLGEGPTDTTDEQPTVRLLLRMAGGLVSDNSWVNPFIAMPESELLARVSHGLRPSSLPGSTFEYSNIGYALAGLAISRAVGTPLPEFVHNEVLLPLSLSRTGFGPPDSSNVVARGYSLGVLGEWIEHPQALWGALSPAGGMYSTVRDLATWIQWLGSALRPHDGVPDGPLRRLSRREMQRPQTPIPISVQVLSHGSARVMSAGYGFGLMVLQDLTRGAIVTHSGGMPGFLANMTWHPESGFGIVVLSNTDVGDPLSLAQDAMFRVLDHHATPARTIDMWDSTRGVIRNVESLVRRWSDEVAKRVFAENIVAEGRVAACRAAIERGVQNIGGLVAPRDVPDIVSVDGPADVTWAIPGVEGELICSILLSPLFPYLVQEFCISSARYDEPRSTRRTHPRDPTTAMGFLGPRLHHEVRWAREDDGRPAAIAR